MSELHRAVQAEIDAHTPALTPPFAAIKARKRSRDRNRLAAAAAALGIVTVASAAFAVPGLGEKRPDRLAPFAAPSPAPSAWDGQSGPSAEDGTVAAVDRIPETSVNYFDLTATFVSPTYGYAFGYVDRGGLTPATELWDPSNQPIDDLNFDPRFDAVETGYAAYFEAASTPVPNGVAIDEWVDEQVTPQTAGGCGVPRSQQAEITVDGQPGRVAQCANQVGRVEATVVAGGRLYLFVLMHDRMDGRAQFDAWIATVELTPDTAVR